MAMPQRDETIEEIKRLDALLEYAVMHGDEAEVRHYATNSTRGATRGHGRVTAERSEGRA